jgi:hypothetical protein
MIPVLLAQEFRLWLDAARSLFIFASHFGMAIWFMSKSASFKCISITADQQASCNLITLFIIIASWIIPTLVLGYSCGLAYFLHRRSNLSSVPVTPTPDLEKLQLEKVSGHLSFQPSIFRISGVPLTPSTPTTVWSAEKQHRASRHQSHQSNIRISRVPQPTPVYDSQMQRNTAHHKSMQAIVYPTSTSHPTSPQAVNPQSSQRSTYRASTLPPATPIYPAQNYSMPSSMYGFAVKAPPPASNTFDYYHQPRPSTNHNSVQSSLYSQASYAYAA